jgi:hypothetical protein
MDMVALNTQGFFQTLYGEDAPGYLAIWTHTPKETHWVAASDPAEMERIALDIGRERDVYFGIGLHMEKLEKGRRGTSSEVIAIPDLWADLDVKGEAYKANNLPPTCKDAMHITEAIPLKPTLIVHSGHGVQAWWLFKELWVFENETEREEAQELSRRFQAPLKHKAKEHGWHMDGTHDISRVLRPPGTYNHKREPVEVRVLRYNEDARYNPSDFEPYLVEIPDDAEHEVDFGGNDHDPEGAKALLDVLKPQLSFRILKAIEGGPDAFEPRPGGDGSPSGADASVCEALVEAGLTDTQIRDIFRTFPIGTNGKYAREGKRGDEYLALTIKNQRNWAAGNRKKVTIVDISDQKAADLLPEEVGQLLSDVEPEQVEWLWESWLALYKLALFDGDPGLGKSVMLLDLAARVSAGVGFPDGCPCEPAGVVLLSAEDGLADTIRPRLDAAGADTSRIVALVTVKGEDGYERSISIPEDIPLIEQAAERVGAKLIVVDPFMAFLSGDANSHRDQDVRRALAPLARMAERLGAAVVVIRHLNKGTHPNPLYRGGGSIGIIGAARMAFLVAKDPQDEERRVLATTKNNLAKPPASLLFRVEEADNGAARVTWLGKSEASAKDLLATPHDQEQADARSEAMEFLNDILSDRPVPAEDVLREAEDAGISESTLRRAKKHLGVMAYRKSKPGESRGKGRWLWKLPIVGLRDVQDGHVDQDENFDHLEHNKGLEARENRIGKSTVQDDHHDLQDDQGVQGIQGDQDSQRLEARRLEHNDALEDVRELFARDFIEESG